MVGNNYSTTHKLVAEKPKGLMSLPDNPRRKAEGGLRKQGFFKTSFPGQPLITVITVVFNGGKYIEQTILSVLEQDYINVEYIIIDGGSTDKTTEIIKRYDNYIDFWVSEPDSGMYEAINKGLEIMNGDYFASLNSDDVYFDHNIISTMIEKFKADVNLFWLYGDFVVIDHSGAIKYRYNIPPFNWRALLFADYCYIPQPTTFMKKQVIDKLGKFDQKFKLASDYEYFLRVGESFRAEKINRPVVKFRFHEERLSEVRAEEAKRENRQIQGRYGLYGNYILRIIYSLLIHFYFKLTNIGVYLKRII